MGDALCASLHFINSHVRAVAIASVAKNGRHRCFLFRDEERATEYVCARVSAHLIHKYVHFSVFVWRTSVGTGTGRGRPAQMRHFNWTRTYASRLWHEISSLHMRNAAHSSKKRKKIKITPIEWVAARSQSAVEQIHTGAARTHSEITLTHTHTRAIH